MSRHRFSTDSWCFSGRDGAGGSIFLDETDGSQSYVSDETQLSEGQSIPEPVDENLNLEDDPSVGTRVRGTDGADVIFAGFASEGVENAPSDVSGTTDEADSVFAEDGDDTVGGSGGDDTLEGGAGNDAILGQSGNDTVSGDEGDDSLNGGEGDDTLAGGSGNDKATGGDGVDRFEFDPSNETEGEDTKISNI